MELVILNLGLALLNGIICFKNNEQEKYIQSSFHAFACGFCLSAAIATLFYFI